MACALTQGYVQDCQDFFGGVKTVYLIELPNVTTPTVTAGVVTVLTKATGKFFRKYDIQAHMAEGDEAGTVTKEAGTRMVKQSVKFPINGMSASIRSEIELLAQNRLLIVLLDNNGLYWLYGREFGMRLQTYSAKTGVKLADKNGYELVFEGEEKYLAPQVGDAIGDVLETPGT
jgi:hypothetical protein